MLITSEFTIERYMGKQPLTLLSIPAGIDTGTLAQYNTFMSNISTIYGSQNSNGVIPVFYKNSNGTPNSNSTLTSLVGGEEYYFISKSTASFPYSIPAISGSISTPEPTPPCSGLPSCCPSVVFNPSSITLVGPPENTYAYINASLSGLVPGKKYNYVYSSLGSNWPAKITPVSGSIFPSSSTEQIESVFNFCQSTGNCTNCFPYILDCDPLKDFAQKNIYSLLEINVSASGLENCPIISDRITVKCNNCIVGITPTPTQTMAASPTPTPAPTATPTPSPTQCQIFRPSLSFAGSPKLSLSSACCSNPVPLTVNVAGAAPGKVYNFSFTSWPTNVQVLPSGGTVGFGDGIGKLSTVVNMVGESSAVIRCTLIDNDRPSENYVDFITIQCTTSC